MTRWTDYQDDISDAISESMDVDWSASVGAQAVVAWLNEHRPISAAPAPEGGAVEDLREALIQADLKIRSLPGTDQSDVEFIRAALTAAPVREEGGAVSIWSDARNVFVRYAELFAMTERYEEASAIADKAAREIEDLATREEAPAEAGEDAIKAACIAWHRAKGSDPFNVLYNGAWCGSFPHQTGPERWTFAVPAMKEAIAAYLRAQPPVREEAQPVAWRWRVKTTETWHATTSREFAHEHDANLCETEPLYTHPAPDALREDLRDRYVAIALMVERAWTAGEPDHVIARTARQALAALQAERKGGAV